MIGPSRKVKGSSEAITYWISPNSYYSPIFVLKPLKLVFIVTSIFALLIGPVIKNKIPGGKINER